MYGRVPPQGLNSTMQQAPKPEAHEPETVPPLALHSEDERQVPFDPEVSELHSRFGKVTMENKLKLFLSETLRKVLKVLEKSFVS